MNPGYAQTRPQGLWTGCASEREKRSIYREKKTNYSTGPEQISYTLNIPDKASYTTGILFAYAQCWIHTVPIYIYRETGFHSHSDRTLAPWHRPMRLLNMSNNFLLAPIPESPDYIINRDIKIAVLGSAGVGKTAMIVRFLTKRFIGDYESNTGNLYSRLVQLEGDQLSIQIQDTPCIQVNGEGVRLPDLASRCIHWADGFILVYSITQYNSHKAIHSLHQHIRKAHPDTKPPVIIVGNKSDLLHARQVQTSEGIQLASELGAVFLEISTSENYENVSDVFQHLCKEVSKLNSHYINGEKRRGSLIPRPKSPNMQDLKRRFKQALSSKAK